MNALDLIFTLLVFIGLIIRNMVDKPHADRLFGNMCVWFIVYVGVRIVGFV